MESAANELLAIAALQAVYDDPRSRAVVARFSKAAKAARPLAKDELRYARCIDKVRRIGFAV